MIAYQSVGEEVKSAELQNGVKVVLEKDPNLQQDRSGLTLFRKFLQRQGKDVYFFEKDRLREKKAHLRKKMREVLAQLN